MNKETQEERFRLLMRQKKLNQNELLRKVLERIGNDSSEEKVNKDKSNFSKYISGERPIPYKYLVPIENILDTSLDYLVNGVKHSDKLFTPEGIRYAAFSDKVEEYKLLDRKDEEGSNPLLSFDEFNRTILDYICQNESKNGIKYLVGQNYLSLDFRGTQLQGSASISQEEVNTIDFVINLVISADDSEVFETFANTWQRIYHYQENLGALINETVLKAILSSKNIFGSLLKKREIPLSEINPGIDDKYHKGLFCNPLLFFLANYALKHAKAYPQQLIRLFDFGYKFNYEANINLKAISDCDGGYDIDERGLICYGRSIYGSIFTYKSEEQPDISIETSHLLAAVNKSISNFKFATRPVLGGWSHHSTRLVDGMMVKQSTHNKTEYEFLELMKAKDVSFVPRLLKQADKLDYLTYFPGQGESYVSEMPWDKTKQIVLALRKINDISKEKLTDGKVYVHGDLSQANVIFKGDKLVGIIDWDSCAVGEEYEDLIYVMWTWLNIGNPLRDNEKIFQSVKDILNLYQAGEKLKQSWADKMLSVMDGRLKNTKKEAANYQRIFTWVRESEIWVELYRDKIKEEIG